jgi:hypothetical protein
MTKISAQSLSAIFIALGALFFAPDARAYVDPNSAGLLYQIFFPIIVAIGLTWRWIKDMARQVWSKFTRKAN